MALGWYFGSNAAGIDVEQRVYSNDSDYEDEWYLEKLTPTKIDFLGIVNSGHDHTSVLEKCRGYLHICYHNNIIFTYGSIQGVDCKNILLNTNVFTSRSHGGFIVDPGASTARTTYIVLSDSGSGDSFYSHYWSGMSAGSEYVLNTDSFSNIDMVLFIGCYTAYGGNGANNLPTAFYNHGANVAVGFSDSIYCVPANDWTEDFYLRLLSGYTVQQSVDYASSLQSISTGLKSAVVCGDGTYRIP